MFDVCRWLVELVDGSPLLIAPWPFRWMVSVVFRFSWRWILKFHKKKRRGDGGISVETSLRCQVFPLGIYESTCFVD